MMTTSITRPQADALAALIRTLRPEWDIPGIVRALSEARDRGSAFELSIAALHCAANLANRTPAVIALAGEHWTKGKPLGATGSAVPGAHETRCEIHDWERASNCRACRSEALERTTQEAALIRQHVPPERIREIRAGVQPRIVDRQETEK